MIYPKMFQICLFFLPFTSLYGMEDPSENVHVVDLSSLDKEFVREQGCPPQRHTLTSPDCFELAREIVVKATGKENPKMQRVLARKLDGKRKKRGLLPFTIPLYDLLNKIKTRKTNMVVKKLPPLDELSNIAEKALPLLIEEKELEKKISNQQVLSQLLVASLLDEKSEEKTARKNADNWKYINGVVAIILPPLVGLCVRFLSGACNCSNTNQFTNSTI